MNTTLEAPDNQEAVQIPGTEFCVSLVDITPTMARAWLLRNYENNRTVNESNLARLKDDIENGNWQVSHQGIAFDSSGKLIDGQHRLMAIANSGKTVTSLVWTNVPFSVFEITDRGQKRDYHTILQIKGHKNDRAFHSTARILTNFIKGFHRGYTPNSIELIEETIAVYGGAIKNIQSKSKGSSASLMMRSAQFLFPCTLGLQIDPDKTYEFIEQYRDGFGIEKGASTGILRDFVLSRANSVNKVSSAEFFELAAYCLSKFIKGEKLKILQRSSIHGEVAKFLASSGLSKAGKFHNSFIRSTD